MVRDGDAATKEALLRHVPLLSELTKSQIRYLARHSLLKTYDEGAAICSPDLFEGRLHAIASGNVLVTREDEPGDEHVLASYIGGESFGELDLFGSTSPDYIARAVERSVVCSFPGPDEQAEAVLAANARLGAEIAERLMHQIGERTRSANALVSEKAPWVESLRRQILVDKLTGLPNAAYIKEEFPQLAKSGEENAVILMVKPDNFKQVNDTYGHDAGDAVLMMLASTVRTHSEEGRCARFKGDVFCVLEDGNDAAIARAEEILGAVKGLDLTAYTRGEEFTLTASVGLAVCDADGVEGACDRAFARVMELREQRSDSVDWHREA